MGEHRGIFVACALVALALLAACSADPQPADPHRADASAATATSPAAAGPNATTSPATSPGATGTSAGPTSSKDRARAEVEEAVRAYYAAMGVALSLGATTDYKRATLASCPCRSLVTDVEELFLSGGGTRGASVELLPALTIEDRGRGLWSASTEARFGSYDELDEFGNVVDSYDARVDRRRLDVVRDVKGRFRVAHVAFEGGS